MHLTESHVYALKDHTYALSRITVYAFNIITKVAFTRITHESMYQDHTCMHLTGSHMYAFNRITHVCI